LEKVPGFVLTNNLGSKDGERDLTLTKPDSLSKLEQNDALIFWSG
jgi:hypothetical protein